jgi:MoxR-like ATPase
MSPERYADIAREVEAQIGRVIVGQHELVRSVLICLLCEGHALLEGVPGLGKTQLLKTLAQTIDVEFGRIQFTPDLMPADILGTQVLEEDAGGRRQFHFRAGPVFANLVLADEVNRATPKTQSALLEAMQERTATVAGSTRPLPRPFFVMATQNPLEMEGTYPLPEAQLDRFLLKAVVPFPEPQDLVAVVERTTTQQNLAVERVTDGPTLTAMIELTRQVPIVSHLVQYAVDLVVATHPERPESTELIRRYVRFGASPRGAQALVLTAKARALLDGRPNVSADDLRWVARSTLRHRLVLGYEATADGVTADDLVADVVASVKEAPIGVRGV